MSIYSIIDDWKQQAACKKAGVPVSDFFEGYEDNYQTQMRIDSLCASCPVQKECKDFAIENKLEGGVFGRKYFPKKYKHGEKKC